MNSAISALSNVNEKIKSVWTLNEENQQHIAEITESISSLAAVSEEISSSMIEIESGAAEIEASCSVLTEDTDGLKEIGKECFEAIRPLSAIESQMDTVLAHMGKMSLDTYYSLSNKELASYLEGAITAHRTWVGNLGNIVETGRILPFQVDATKCRFGHFYRSLEPPIPEFLAVWRELGKMHEDLHRLGAKVIDAMFDGNTAQAKQYYQEVVASSEKLIVRLEQIRSRLPEGSAI